MFDIGWVELMLIGVVALIVIGPRDLPEMFRTLGRFTAKLRSMSREFQRAMETAARESGVKDVAADLKTMTSPKNLGLDAVKEAADKFERWDPLKPKAATPKSPAATPAADLPAMPAAADPAPLPPAGSAALGAPAPALGPATQALADRVASRKAIVDDAAEKLRAVAGAPVATVQPKARARTPGRVRSIPAGADAAARAAAPNGSKSAKITGE